MVELTATSERLMALWLEARDDALVPHRKAMTPDRLKSILPYLMVLEWEGDQRLLFRLAGTQVVDGFGLELRGRNLFDFAHADNLDAQRWVMSRVCTRPQGLCIDAQFPGRDGRLQDYQILYLPLAEDDGERRRIISVISAVNRSYDRYELDGPARITEYTQTAYVDLGVGIDDGFEPPA